MIKNFFFIFVLVVSLFSDDSNTTAQVIEDDLIVVEDKSGLSDDEVRQKAKNADTKESQKSINIKDVFDATDTNGTVNLQQLKSKWEDLSPTPKKYDWVQTKSGEWFKGEIRALFDDELEFDSDEIGLYTFDFEDILQIKSYNIISVNIENVASFSGILRLKNKRLHIIQGEHDYKFDVKDIVSFAPEGELERNFWSGKVTLSMDVRRGNVTQQDYSANINLKRRTSRSRLALDYLGRLSSVNQQGTANDHRLNEKYDVYLSRSFFWTPISSEFYMDKYKNIDKQFTAGLGIGYTPIDTKTLEWSVSGGPAVISTQYIETANGLDLHVYSAALELSTKVEIAISKITDFTYDYKLTYTDHNSGRYKHHMILKLENELTSWLDIDITGVWDYILQPTELNDGTIPLQSDYQLLLGFGIDF